MAAKKTTPKKMEVKQEKTVKRVKENLAFKSVSELLEMSKLLHKEIVDVRLRIRADKEKNTRQEFNKRKQLARVLTVLSEKKTENKV